MASFELSSFPYTSAPKEQQEWLEKHLPWTVDGSPDFRPINANRSWTPLTSRQLWGGAWKKLSHLMADPTLNEIQVQALGTDPTALSVISEGPRGILVHPDLQMSAEELLQGLTLISSSGLGGKGVRGSRGLSQSLEQDVIVNTNLDDGPRVSRLTAVVPPGSNAPCCAIRRFPVSAIPEAVMVGKETLSRSVHPYAWPGEPLPAAEDPLQRLLQEAEKEAEHVPWASCTYKALAWIMYQFSFEKNAVVYGPTSSGKTSVLQTLISLTNHNARTISVEKDANELFLPHINKVSLFCTDKGKDPKRAPELILEAILRLTPEIIAYGELRGGEAFSYIDAVSSGHKGMTTIHAKSPLAAINRLVGMAQRGAPEGTSGSDVRDVVLGACNLLIQVRRQTFVVEGKVRRVRRVAAIHEAVLEDGKAVEFVPIFQTRLNALGEPCLVFTGHPGTLTQSLRDDHLPVPAWIKK